MHGLHRLEKVLGASVGQKRESGILWSTCPFENEWRAIFALLKCVRSQESDSRTQKEVRAYTIGLVGRLLWMQSATVRLVLIYPPTVKFSTWFFDQ